MLFYEFQLASQCRFKRRWVFFGLCDFKPFLSNSLLIVRLVTLHPDVGKSSCSSSCITIGIWLIRRPNFLDNLGEFFVGAPVIFLFSTMLRLLNLAMNELTIVKGIFKLLEIFIYHSPSFQSFTISAFLWITQFFTSYHEQNLLVGQIVSESSG